MRFTMWTALSLVLLLLGIAFWLYQASTYGNALDVGVYSIGITLIGFGLVGALVSMREPRPAQA